MMENLAARPAVANTNMRIPAFGIIVSEQCLYFLEVVRVLHVLVMYAQHSGTTYEHPRHVRSFGDLSAC